MASESYESFAKGLQSEIAETLTDRPQKANVEFFLNNVVKNAMGEELLIDKDLANTLHRSLYRNMYVDNDDNLTEKYYKALEEDKIELPEEVKNFKQGIIQLVGKIYSEGLRLLLKIAEPKTLKN